MSDDFDARMQAAMSDPGMPASDVEQAEMSLESIAITQHEACLAFGRAGFARDEALYLTAAMFSGSPGRPPAALN